MEPLFLAVICGCKAGLFREALHEVYVPRIQRGKASFAAHVLGARGALLSALVQFFGKRCWGSPVQADSDEPSLTAEDQLLVLMQAALNLTATRGMGAPEARSCYESAEHLCHSLGRPLLLYQTLMGQWHYSFITDKMSATLQIAKRIYSLSQELNDAALQIGSHGVLASTLCFLGEFDMARQHATLGVHIWRSGAVQSPAEELSAPIVICLCLEAISEWHLKEVGSGYARIAEAISLAKELDDTHTLATALHHAAIFYQLERLAVRVESVASDMIELSTRENFAQWLCFGKLFRGWARSILGEPRDGLSWIEDALREYRESGGILCVPYSLAMKAEALDLADRTSEALEAMEEAVALEERFEDRWWSAELHRLRGVFLTKRSADDATIEAAFCRAIGIAKHQKSVSLMKRAEASYAEYRQRQRKA